MAYLVGMPRAAWMRIPTGPLMLANQWDFMMYGGLDLSYQRMALFGTYSDQGGLILTEWNKLLGLKQTSNTSKITISKTLKLGLPYFCFLCFSLSNPIDSKTSIIIAEAGPNTNAITVNVDASGNLVILLKGVEKLTLPINSWLTTHTLAVTVSSTELSVALDGVLYTVSSTTTLSWFHYLSFNGTACYQQGPICFMKGIHEIYSPQRALEISENPWQIFKPRIARFISIPSTGTVTFKPYWARSRSSILGSGV